MRFEITLTPANWKYKLPLNYQYPLLVNVYRIFSLGDANFTDWLHTNGYGNNGKNTKLFTFSRLFTEPGKITGEVLSTNGPARFFFSTPGMNKQLQVFLNGLLNSYDFIISDNGTFVRFTITGINSVEPSEFGNDQIFRMLSPCVSSIKHEGKIKYLQPGDNAIEDNLANNLIWKYELIHGEPYTGDIKIEFDRDYIERHRRLSKLVRIKTGREDEQHIRGFICPIKITTSSKMLAVAYDCGLGEKNSLGFGMLDTY